MKFNNTQNEITTWDQYSNSAEQERIQEELKTLGHEYSLKRGFSNISCKLGIEQVSKPIIALHGDYNSANRGKNYIFENTYLYNEAFIKVKGRHVIFAYTLSKAIEKVFSELKIKEHLLEVEARQLSLLRNLKSKNFITALIGEALDVIVGKKCNKKLVSFTYDASLTKNYSLEDLISKWIPIVKTIISFIPNKIEGDFSDFINQEGILQRISGELTAFVYSLKETNPNPAFDEFSALVEQL